MRSDRFISLLVQLRPMRSQPAAIPLGHRPVHFRPMCLRTYTTHREQPQQPRGTPGTGTKTASAFDGADTVGPFPLGVGPSGRSRTWKKWGELNVKGKMGRTVRQTGNLGIILFGGGLFVLLTLSLTTELFATNSPSVLYSKAVDLIRASDALNPHLLPPLSFTHTPHSAAPVRGTTPVAHRTVRHPSSGRDHMLLTFYVHGRGINEKEPMSWVTDTWGSLLSWARDASVSVGLIEDSGVPSSTHSAPPAPSEAVTASTSSASGSGWLTSLTSVFGSLRSTPTTPTQTTTKGLPPPGTYTVGEVHGDYVKNASGQYQLLSLIIDIPSSGASYPARAVVYWSPEADREGLLGRIGARGR